MEMHSRQSLYKAHGIGDRHNARLPMFWAMDIFALLTRAKSALRAKIEARRAASELAALDDRMLRDIGIGRGDIERVTLRR